jgi:hypothetical protein
LSLEKDSQNCGKINNEMPTMGIVHSTLRDSTTPYPERYMQGKKTLELQKQYDKISTF